MDINTLRETYANYPDYKLVVLAVEESQDLVPNAILVLKNEIRTRKLSEDLIKIIDSKLLEPSLEDIEYYTKVLEDFPCASCSNSSSKLNAVLIKGQIRVGCKRCLKKMHESTISNSALGLGIFGFLRNFKESNHSSNLLKQDVATQYLRLFVSQNIGVIALSKKEPKYLVEVLRKTNLTL